MTGLTETDWIVAFDPGKTTGFAFFSPGVGFDSTQLDFHATGSNFAYMLDRLDPPHTVICERFTITVATARNAQAPWSLEATGMLRWLLLERGLDEVPFLQPAPGEREVGLLHLRNVGWRKPGQVHANDAAAHLLAWLLESGLLPTNLRDRVFTDRH